MPDSSSPILPVLALTEVWSSSPYDTCSHFLTGLPDPDPKPLAALGWEDGFQHTAPNDRALKIWSCISLLESLHCPWA